MERRWRKFAVALAAWAAAAAAPAGAAAAGPSVLAYHNGLGRAGLYVVPGLTWDRARALHPDPAFKAEFAGHVYAQPLYWAGADGAGMLLVATEDNSVLALDARSGKEIWRRVLGRPVPGSALPCGDIDPLGITGTPVIDAERRAIYLNAVVAEADGVHHRIFALALKDGAPLPGWPVDVAAALKARQQDFDARAQNQRGALAIMDRTLYVPFGGHYGDCGDYHGWVVGVPLDDPKAIRSWRTRGRGAGIWAPGGISGDGRHLFVATGNTVSAAEWSDGEAVFRLSPDLRRSERPEDFFALENWRQLDDRDADLGGTNPLPLDLAGGGQRRALLLALGKDRNAYLLDRDNLGGMGGSLVAKTVAARAIRTAPAAYPARDGMLVAFSGAGANCPERHGDNNLTVLEIGAGSPPALGTAWCGRLDGAGAPIVTTTDGRANPIVWIVGAEGDDRLHGFKGDTGEPLFGTERGAAMRGLRHFQTLLATADRLYVAADGRIYAFVF